MPNRVTRSKGLVLSIRVHRDHCCAGACGHSLHSRTESDCPSDALAFCNRWHRRPDDTLRQDTDRSVRVRGKLPGYTVSLEQGSVLPFGSEIDRDSREPPETWDRRDVSQLSITQNRGMPSSFDPFFSPACKIEVQHLANTLCRLLIFPCLTTCRNPTSRARLKRAGRSIGSRKGCSPSLTAA